ncbi:hypothetical protein BGX24_002082 [Mortierella sp. AD032]|nr:hypothetical protein BGX24_002082 [Mortierella sp. AD032]
MALKLVGFTTRYPPTSSEDDGRLTGINRRRVFQQLKDLSLTLDMFHVSFASVSLDDDGNDDERFNQMTRELCLALSEWNLWSPDVTLTLLKELEILPNVVTSLELLWTDKIIGNILSSKFKNQWLTPRLLHQYLCASPHLLHLRMMQVQYMIGGMDLHRR